MTVGALERVELWDRIVSAKTSGSATAMGPELLATSSFGSRGSPSAPMSVAFSLMSSSTVGADLVSEEGVGYLGISGVAASWIGDLAGGSPSSSIGDLGAEESWSSIGELGSSAAALLPLSGLNCGGVGPRVWGLE
jgi:hypothetical protein